MDFLTVDDLAPFATIEPAKAAAMIADVSAQAFAAAPCLAAEGFGDDPQRVAAVKAILRAAVLRWHEAGTGALTQETAGPFSRSMDTRTERKGVFLPGELAALRDLCASFSGPPDDDAGTVSMIPALPRDDLYWRPDLRFQWGWPG